MDSVNTRKFYSRMRSILRNSYIVAISESPINRITGITTSFIHAQKEQTPTLSFMIAPPEHMNIKPDTNILQIYFDQMNVMTHQHCAAKHNTLAWSDPHNPLPADDA